VTKGERIQAAIDRAPVDRVPYAFWRHFPDADHSPRALAEATLAFQSRWGSDFIKLTPAGGYAVREWGCIESAEVHPDGHRPCAICAVRSVRDWAKIRPLDPAAADGYAPQVEALIRIGGDDRADCAILPTLFSPLSLARKLSADRLSGDLREHPDAVTAALEAITETLIRYATLVLDEGAGGIFYSIQTASLSVCSETEYAVFGEPYDRRVLESVEGRSGLTIVHCHGDRLLWERLAQLPGHAWNWDDRATPPSLGEGKALVGGAVVGGLHQWQTLRDGTPDRAATETRDAIAQTGGIGLIVGPGCVVPPAAPDANLAAVVDTVGRR
jgi:uroporphyrinogen decarboxylase